MVLVWEEWAAVCPVTSAQVAHHPHQAAEVQVDPPLKKSIKSCHVRLSHIYMLYTALLFLYIQIMRSTSILISSTFLSRRHTHFVAMQEPVRFCCVRACRLSSSVVCGCWYTCTHHALTH